MTKTEIADALDRIKQIAEKLDEAITKLVIAVESDEEAEKAPAEEPKAVPAKAVTLEEIRAALTDLTSAKGADTTKQLLAEYGVKKLSDIFPADYSRLLVDAKAWADE